MSSVGPSSSVHGSLADGMGDLALFGVELARLGVRLQVLEQRDQIFGGLLGEASVGVVDLLAQSMSTNTSSVSSEWNDGFVLENSLEIVNSLEQAHSFQGSDGLRSKFVVCSQVINSCFGG